MKGRPVVRRRHDDRLHRQGRPDRVTIGTALRSKQLYRLDATTIINCIDPGQIAMAAATSLPAEVVIGELGSMTHTFPTFGGCTARSRRRLHRKPGGDRREGRWQRLHGHADERIRHDGERPQRDDLSGEPGRTAAGRGDGQRDDRHSARRKLVLRDEPRRRSWRRLCRVPGRRVNPLATLQRRRTFRPSRRRRRLPRSPPGPRCPWCRVPSHCQSPQIWRCPCPLHPLQPVTPAAVILLPDPHCLGAPLAIHCRMPSSLSAGVQLSYIGSQP